MQIRPSPLPPDIQYVLDGAVEYGELDGLSHAALNLLGDRGVIDNLVERPKRNGDYSDTHLGRRQAMCFGLCDYARAIVTELDAPHQRAFVAAALIRERYRIHELAEVLAAWNYDDSTIGGALEHWRRGSDIRLRADGSPRPRVLRRLRSPAAIRRYVRTDPGRAVGHHARLAKGICSLPWPAHPDEVKLLDALFTSADEERGRRRTEALNQFLIEQEAKRIGQPLRRMIRDNRKRLARSATTAAQILGPAPVQAFVRGETVAIPTTNDLIFQVRSENVTALGHSGIRVGLTAIRGEKLADLCLYFDETPPLDQLVAIALHVEAGNAGELLNTGNLFNMTTAGTAHPALTGRAPATVAAGRPFFARRQPGYDMTRQDQMRKAYERAYGNHYGREIEDMVWRRQAPRLRRFFALIPERETA
jgi:hypothetical protein